MFKLMESLRLPVGVARYGEKMMKGWKQRSGEGRNKTLNLVPKRNMLCNDAISRCSHVISL